MAVLRTLFTVHTTGVIIVLFFICVFLINGGITEEEIGSPLRVAQCRARCIKTFSDGVDSHKACFQDPDCYMCWENCQLLHSNFPVWGAICSKKGICFPGCQQACQFHLEKITQRAPVQVITHGEEVITLTGNTASWPRPGASDVDGPFVYVVMRRLPGKAWKQITQTLDLSTRIPAGPTAGTIRVLVVNKDGLVTIYSPIVKSGLSGAEAIIKSLGKDSLFGLGLAFTSIATSGQGKRINTEIMSVTTVDPLSMLDDGDHGSWNLREVSLIHQKVLVIAEIAWDAQQTSGSGGGGGKTTRAVYFVTWEVDGGGLKGNLFTDSTCVTLSLWPDTIYHIQVELVTHNSPRTEQSEDLVLDTHRAVAVEFDTPLPIPASAAASSTTTTPAAVHGSSPHKVAVQQPRPAQLELVAGVCAAVIVFLAILIALTWRWRRQHRLYLPHHAKFIQDDYLTTAAPNLSRVYPPIVTLIGDQSTPERSSESQNYTRPSAAPTSLSSSTAAIMAAIPNDYNNLVSDESATAVASISHAPV